MTGTSSRRSAEDALRERDRENRQQAVEAARRDSEARRHQLEEIEQQRQALLAQLVFEQQAAISRLHARDWDVPDGEIGTVITSEGWLGLSFLRTTREMALWPVGHGAYLGSDGNLWYDPAHVSMAYKRFRPYNPSNLGNIEIIRFILDKIHVLGT
ncbi:MAG TPA: hypothetical protein VGE13_01565 [Candidatus Saccharimonadales bacterium]